MSEERKVPKRLSECYETDITARRLMEWAEWVQKAGVILCWITVIVGVIISISESIIIDYTGDKEFSFIVFLLSLITWGIYAFLEYCGFLAVAWLIMALGKIVQNTKVTASVALYRAAKEEGFVNSEKKTEASIGNKQKPSAQGYTNQWICKSCGTQNSAGTLSCIGCGQYK